MVCRRVTLGEVFGRMKRKREREREKESARRARKGNDRYQRRNRSIWNEIKYARESTGVITSVEEKYSAPLPEG